MNGNLHLPIEIRLDGDSSFLSIFGDVVVAAITALAIAATELSCCETFTIKL
jgi:hypothetical protein